MDLIIEDRPGENAPEFSVSEISGAVKRVIEGEFGRLRVRGEVGRVYAARSGHLYFDIKDDRNVLASVSWKGQVSRLSTRPEEGMEVVATGKLTTFGSQSKYQLNVEDLTPAGEGALMAMLEKRKKQFAAEGLFDPARKKPLPMLPTVIGVITSPTGAVIRDILHRLRDRFPREVLVWPVAVQGRTSAAEVAHAIKGFNAIAPGGDVPRPDLLIVARGGGSIEDLWGFNDEAVVRAVSASAIPVISAVGHETDTTLIDYVADQRAPTPTAAAEIAVPVRLDLMARLDDQGARMSRAMSLAVSQRRQRLQDLTRGLPRAQDLFTGPRQRLDMAEARLPSLASLLAARRERLGRAAAVLRPRLLRERVMQQSKSLGASQTAMAQALRHQVARQRAKFDATRGKIDPRRATAHISLGNAAVAQQTRQVQLVSMRQIADLHKRIESLEHLRQTLGYEATLRRGYAVVRSGDQVITKARQAKSAEALQIEFADGRVPVNVHGGKAKPPRGAVPPSQGTLFD